MEFIQEFWKALGGVTGDLGKRFSSAHRGGVMKVAGHLGKAMECHNKAAVFHRDEHKAAGSMMDECAKGLESIGKAHELHKAYCAKAAAASESTAYPHDEVNGHLEAAKAAMVKMADKAKEMSEAHKSAHGKMSETNDQHELAKGAIGKVASSWVGERGETPADATTGYTPSQAGHVELTGQSTMTEGEVPDTDPFNPMYDFKAARPSTAVVGSNQVTEAEAKLREELAATKATLAATQKTVEILGNQPGEAKGRTFGGASAAAGANEPAKGSVDSIIKDLVARGQISELDLRNIDKPEVRERIARKVFGHQASAMERGDTSFAKSLMSPDFRGDADLASKRGSAAGAGIFKTV